MQRLPQVRVLTKLFDLRNELRKSFLKIKLFSLVQSSMIAIGISETIVISETFGISETICY